LHAAAACLLFGVLRRTLQAPRLRERFGNDATWLALVIAGLWAVHPLQTAAVDWISERAEVLMGGFYLLTLYGFIRGTRGWLMASVAGCWLGALTKETIVTAPLLVLLYDRTFIAGAFRECFRRRWGYYLALGGAWVIVALLLPRSGSVQVSAGFGHGISAGTYILTSCRSILLYLKLAFWPAPLVFYYGMAQVGSFKAGLPFLLGLGLLVAGMAWAWIRRPAIGFAAAWVLIILAPTTSFVPLAQPTAEYRFYLSLAGVIALVVLGAYSWLGRRGLLLALAVLPLGAMTLARNPAYASAVEIWRDTAQKVPSDAEVRREYGLALLETPGRLDEAIAELRASARLRPGAQGFRELGWALAHKPDGQVEALRYLDRALRCDPDDPLTRNALGAVLMQGGRLREAEAQFERALALRPGMPTAMAYLAQAHRALGSELLREPGRIDEAIAELRAAVRLQPGFTAAHTDLGWALAHTPGGLEDGIAEVRAGLHSHPDDPYAHNTLGMLLMRSGELTAAAGEFRAALRLKPDLAAARSYLTAIEAQSGEGAAR
ncbi:MAG TPA: tetratricopeptide repeat protein, partial [Opitutaceae bacterium]|nr:tetratricopeptide repeat protein [Opitutaceae bacterium]